MTCRVESLIGKPLADQSLTEDLETNREKKEIKCVVELTAVSAARLHTADVANI